MRIGLSAPSLQILYQRQAALPGLKATPTLLQTYLEYVRDFIFFKLLVTDGDTLNIFRNSISPHPTKF
jgi:hypothetical protein